MERYYTERFVACVYARQLYNYIKTNPFTNTLRGVMPPVITQCTNIFMYYSECGVTEEAVRRYLARKPMTTTELLTKFKSKRTGVSSERLVETMTQILKRINPVKQNINGKMYLSIKQT